jgi:hypothetical protein
MQSYVVDVPHTPEECGRGAQEWLELDQPRKEELFGKLRFGCEAGVHETWLIAEFASEEEVWSYVVPTERAKTRVVPVSSMTFEEMLSAHDA